MGTDRSETLHGTPGPDVIVALGGNDLVLGGRGADLICGGPGNDTLLGGAGPDLLSGGPGTDALEGGSGADRLAGAEDDDRMAGGGGADSLDGGEGTDLLDHSRTSAPVRVDLGAGTGAGEGRDRLTGIEDVWGTPFDDTLIGDAGGNTLIGAGGNDHLAGGDGDDVLAGGPGADVLEGGAGDDDLSGGPGADRLDGGLGTDTLAGDDFDTCTGGEFTAGCPTGVPGVPTRAVPVWGAEFMAWDATVTLAEAVRQAQGLTYIVAPASRYRPYVAAMKAVNPALVLLAYVNGTATGSPTRYPDSWYARDAVGEKVRSFQFDTWLMDPSSPQWAEEVVRLCRARVEGSGYDGCFLDGLGTAWLNPGYGTGLPVNPATGRVWTRREWLEATARIGARTSAALEPRPVFGNGIGHGARYFDGQAPTARLLDGVRGAMAESFVRSPEEPISTYRDEEDWRKDVDMLVDAAARGEVVLAMTKVWAPGSREVKDAWHRYALATFLLGATPGMTFFAFRYDRAPTTAHPYWTVPVGSPLGSYEEAGGVYRRAFSRGWAYVNPTSRVATVELDGSYRTLEGTVVRTLVLGPHTGEVLTRA